MSEAEPGAENASKSEEAENEDLDPRVQVELEKLNKASDDINKLELELDEARASFRQVLTESTQRLNALAKKLGNCIEKARPYYEARMRAKEAQIDTQNAALRFERACSQQAAAKEMVYLAEQGFFKNGQPFDPAWQEMLNHATMKVNDAERERLESEVEHQVTARIFNEREQKVKELQRQLKRSITKSRPYFEQKAKFNQHMEEQKRIVSQLEQAVIKAKRRYSEALSSLEEISDEIHRQRREAKMRLEMGQRGSGVGAETPEPAPLSESSDSGDSSIAEKLHFEKIDISSGSSSSRISPSSQGYMRKSTSVESFSRGVPVTRHARPTSIAGSIPMSLSMPEGHAKMSPAEFKVKLDAAEVRSENGDIDNSINEGSIIAETAPSLQVCGVSDAGESDSQATGDLLTPGSEASSAQGPMTSPDTENEADTESQKTNAEIMDALQRAKELRSSFLRPNRSRDDLFDETSDNESITGSLASVSVLDDEQIESLMMETGEYITFLTKQPNGEPSSHCHMMLPANLTYLQDYMKFRPEWVEASLAQSDTTSNESPSQSPLKRSPTKVARKHSSDDTNGNVDNGGNNVDELDDIDLAFERYRNSPTHRVSISAKTKQSKSSPTHSSPTRLSPVKRSPSKLKPVAESSMVTKL